MHATKSIARVLVIFALVLAATLGMNAQKKDKTMEQQVFYRTVKVDGLSIFYREAGPKNAPVILLLHGLPSSSRMFQPLLTSAPHTPRSYTETAGPPSTAGVPSSPLASRNPWIATRRNRSFTVVSKPPTSKSPACRNRCSAHAESFPPLQLSRIFFILLSKHDPVTRHSRAPHLVIRTPTMSGPATSDASTGRAATQLPSGISMTTTWVPWYDILLFFLRVGLTKIWELGTDPIAIRGSAVLDGPVCRQCKHHILNVITQWPPIESRDIKCSCRA